MSRLFAALLVVCLCGTLAATSQQAQKPPQERPPVFRAGAHYVKVDAYPSRDGHIVEGLTADDFEILEDGKPQAIDALEFIRFDAFTSDEERRDPNSQRDAFALAADPNYRVFVLYLDAYHVDLTGSHNLRQPLVNMLQRILGPRDLFGMLTPRQMPRDLILGRQTQMIEEQLGGDTNWIWGLQGRFEPEPEELALLSCFGDALGGAVIARRRLDKVFCGSRRPRRVARWAPRRAEEHPSVLTRLGTAGLGRGAPQCWREHGIHRAADWYHGRGQDHARHPPPRRPACVRWCMDELQREASQDFRLRHRDLLRAARQANVAFYPVNPTGLEAPVTARGADYLQERTDRLIEMAINTDGLAVVNSNDLTPA